jgi:hypothetical protein
MEPSATLPLVTPSHDGLAMHEILLLQFIFLVEPYLLGMNFLKSKK